MPAPNASKRPSRKRNQLYITLGVMGVLAVGVGLAIRSGLSTPEPNPALAVVQPTETAAEENPATATIEQEPAGPQLIEDNGRTLWAAPTDGKAIDLAYLPPGCQMIVALRPEAIVASDSAKATLRALGPGIERLVQAAESKTGVRFAAMKRLTVGLRPSSVRGLEAVLICSSHDAPPAGAGVYAPAGAEGVRVFAAADVLTEVRELDGAPPPLRRELEQLVAGSNADLQATIIVTPNFLYADGKELFSGAAAALREPLYLETPDEVRGLMLSLDAGERFYWELRAASVAEMPASQLAATLYQRLTGWPSALQLSVIDMNPAPHGRRVVAGLPAMARAAADYARYGVQSGQAVLNGYLPSNAGPSLALAAELTLAQLSTGFVGAPAAATTAAREPQSIAEKLRAPATVAFARDTLEMAVRYLSDEMATPITIQGADLQLEGITKNQSFELDVQNRPAEEVLVTILTKANPDKTATGPADPKQKLVYVVSGNGLVVTTRAAAAKRGDSLPKVFSQ